MPYYLIQVGYTPEAWASMVKSPQDRIQRVRPAVESLGGRMDSGWLSFGEYDVVAVIEMPDNVSAAGFAVAVAAGGAVRAFKTTPLLTTEEGIQAMKKAQKVGYRPPSAAAPAKKAAKKR